MKTLCHATLETANFQFDAYGETVAEAAAAMRRGWTAHKRQTQAIDTWSDVESSVQFRLVELGESWRDREQLTDAPKKPKGTPA